MEGDLPLDQQQAEQLHWQQSKQGSLMMWVVTWNSRDYPWQAVARPTLIRNGQDYKLRAILRADSVRHLREMLPRQLTRIERHPEDDPVIMEVWL